MFRTIAVRLSHRHGSAMHATFSHLVEQYGLLGVFLGAFIEGELGVIAGGAAAHLGELNFFHVVLSAWVAAVLSAQLLFLAVRSQRERRWMHKITDKRAFALAVKWIDRHPTLFCLGYRFVYGLRVVGPVAISLSHISTRSFFLFNLCTALAWATLGAGLGWLFGPELAHLLHIWFTPKRFFAASAVALLLFLGIISWRARKAARVKATAEAETAV